MHNLRYLTLANNSINFLHENTFKGLDKLMILLIHGDSLIYASKATFDSLAIISFISVDHYQGCCFTKKITYCSTPNTLSTISCDIAIIDSKGQERIQAFCSFVIILKNSLAISFFIFIHRRKGSNTLSMLYLHACGSLIAVYYLTLLGIHLAYNQQYIFISHMWMKTGICRVCGFLANYAIHVSFVLVLCIALERFNTVRYPFQAKRFHDKSLTIVFFHWVMPCLLSVLSVIYMKPTVSDCLLISPGTFSAMEVAILITSSIIDSMSVFTTFVSSIIIARTLNQSRCQSGRTNSSTDNQVVRRMIAANIVNVVVWASLMLVIISTFISQDPHSVTIKIICIVSAAYLSHCLLDIIYI